MSRGRLVNRSVEQQEIRAFPLPGAVASAQQQHSLSPSVDETQAGSPLAKSPQLGGTTASPAAPPVLTPIKKRGRHGGLSSNGNSKVGGSMSEAMRWPAKKRRRESSRHGLDTKP